MLSFKQFVLSIYDAILTANEALQDRYLEMLNKYFEPEDGSPPGSGSGGTGGTGSGTGGTGSGTGGTGGTSSGTGTGGTGSSGVGGSGAMGSGGAIQNDIPLLAKTILLKYPYVTDDGIKDVDIQVPVLTVVPLALSQIDQMKLVTDFQMTIVNGELEISFPTSSSGSSTANSQMEITFGPAEVPDGVKIILEGYDRLLRAQIPG